MEISMELIVCSEDIRAFVDYGGRVKNYIGWWCELYSTNQQPIKSFQTIIVGETIMHGPIGIIVQSASENKKVLGEADVVIITGSTLVNGSIVPIKASFRCFS